MKALTGKVDLGIWAALGSAVLWGALPLYWSLLRDVSPVVIVCQRIIWSLVFLLPLVILTGRMGELAKALRDARILRAFFCSSLIIAMNWGLYIWAVNTGRVVEASLGYFISPLITICMGVALFRDRPSRARWAAIILAASGIIAEICINGAVPWSGLGISATFSTYALLRKLEPVESLPGLTLEMVILFPFALAFALWQHYASGPAIWGGNLRETLLLMGTGVVTSVPLILYAYGARHLSFMTLGILQYLAPTLTALIGFFIFMEPATSGRLVSLTVIVAALVIYTADSFRAQAPAGEKSVRGKDGGESGEP